MLLDQLHLPPTPKLLPDISLNIEVVFRGDRNSRIAAHELPNVLKRRCAWILVDDMKGLVLCSLLHGSVRGKSSQICSRREVLSFLVAAPPFPGTEKPAGSPR
jgi:hypothetical protein